jgi:hypothetical protein
MRRFGRILSLGPNCKSKYQARRILAARLELNVEPKERTPVPGAPNCVFDWQITPLTAVKSYFRSDFALTYELSHMNSPTSAWRAPMSKIRNSERSTRMNLQRVPRQVTSAAITDWRGPGMIIS